MVASCKRKDGPDGRCDKDILHGHARRSNVQYLWHAPANLATELASSPIGSTIFTVQEAEDFREEMKSSARHSRYMKASRPPTSVAEGPVNDMSIKLGLPQLPTHEKVCTVYRRGSGLSTGMDAVNRSDILDRLIRKYSPGYWWDLHCSSHHVDRLATQLDLGTGDGYSASFADEEEMRRLQKFRQALAVSEASRSSGYVRPRGQDDLHTALEELLPSVREKLEKAAEDCTFDPTAVLHDLVTVSEMNEATVKDVGNESQVTVGAATGSVVSSSTDAKTMRGGSGRMSTAIKKMFPAWKKAKKRE